MSKSRSDSLALSQDLLWMGLAFLILIPIAYLLTVDPNDYWWYVRVGSDTLSQGGVPQVDTYSFTQAGQPVAYHSWLSAVLFWLAYRAGGMTLTVLLRGVMIAITFGILWMIMRRAGAKPGLAFVLTVLVGLASTNNWSVRPQMFAYPLFVLTLWLCLRWREKGTRAIWFLPLISLLWTNLHGSFVLLFPLVGAAVLFDRRDRRTLALALALALLATLINPRGWGAWSYVWMSVTVPSSQGFSMEWAPPVNLGWQLNLFFGSLLVFALLAGRSPRKLAWLDWVWFLGFGWLALSGLRYVIWFEFILLALMANLAADWFQGGPRGMRLGIPWLNFSIATILLLLPLSFLPGLRERWMPSAPPVLASYTPVESAAWLARHPELPGQLWSDATLSSYLIFALPERPVWIDTRFEVYPVEHWHDYRLIIQGATGWDDILKRDNVNLILSSYANSGLIDALRASDDWCQVHADQAAIIFARTREGMCPLP